MRQSSISTRASRRMSNSNRFNSSSRSLPLNDSIHAFCHGDPGSMKTVSTVVSLHQSATACATKFRAVVEPDVPRHATLERESIQDGDHRVGVDPAVDEDRGTLPGEFVDDVQQLQRPSIGGGCRTGNPGPTPHPVGSGRTSRPASRTRQPLRTAPLGHPESFLAPQAPHAFIVDDPPRPAGSFRCTPPPPPRALPGERHEQLPQLTLLLTRDRR